MNDEYELDRETIDTDAGQYTVIWYYDDGADQPYDEGFVLAVDGYARYGYDSRIDVKHGDAGDFVWDVLRTHGKYHEDSWDRELCSGAALVRYLTLKGHKGVTLVDRDYYPEEPSTNRRERVYGVAWAPDDATDPAEYVKIRLQEWRAWAKGECFGWVLQDPTGQEIDSCWGYYDTDGERKYTLSVATDSAKSDAEDRITQANRVGAGIIGLI